MSSAEAKGPSPATDLGALCDRLIRACTDGDQAKGKQLLEELRRTVILHGIRQKEPSDAPATAEADASELKLTLRGRVWKALLGITESDAQAYVNLVKRGPNPMEASKTMSMYEKIRGDTFRTFPKEDVYNARVPQQSLVRVLNSFSWKYGERLKYVQGMNTIAACALYCMPEVDAFHTTCAVITQHTPLYWVSDMVGAHAGTMLVQRVLQEVDPVLSHHLDSKIPDPRIYAYSPVSSLSAGVPPFSELMQLWDFLLCVGVHINVVCVAAQIMLLRDKLLATTNPNSLLSGRVFPNLKARAIISVTMGLIPRIPKDLFGKIRLHATDPKVAGELVGRAVNFEPIQL